MDDSRSVTEPLRERLIVDYIGTVRRIAHRLARTLPQSVSLEDLIGAGLLGMADALAKYEGPNFDNFAGYAARRVRGAMIDHLRDADPLSRQLRLFVRHKEGAIRDLAGELGRAPEEVEVAERMGLSIAIYRAQLVLTSFRGAKNLDTVTGASIDGSQFPDNKTETADLQLMRKEQRARLKSALGELPQRLQTIVSMYYESDYSMREIGAHFGITESRVCQLHREAIAILREASVQSHEADAVEGDHRLSLASGWV